jgi:hypothetical protein
MASPQEMVRGGIEVILSHALHAIYAADRRFFLIDFHFAR